MVDWRSGSNPPRDAFRNSRAGDAAGASGEYSTRSAATVETSVSRGGLGSTATTRPRGSASLACRRSVRKSAENLSRSASPTAELPREASYGRLALDRCHAPGTALLAVGGRQVLDD